MNSRGNFAILVMLFSFKSFAAGSASPCDIKNYSDLFQCVTNQSNEGRILDQQLKTATELEGVANQWINPELGVESLQKGSEKSEISATLLFDISLNGKRAALINQSKAEYEKSKAVYELDKSQSKLDSILKVYRLSHLKKEIQIEKEAVATFSKITRQYQNRAALNPEQEVSSTVFNMAMSDHELSLAGLQAEEDKLLQELEVSTNLNRDVIINNLPPVRTQWPTISAQNSNDSSPYIRIAKSDISSALSLRDKADSDAWGDLKVGPTVKQVKDNSVTDNFFGVSVTLPLPAFNTNGAAKKYSSQKLKEAEMSYELAQRKIPAQRAQLQKKYDKLVSLLKKGISGKAIEDNHEKMERLFFRGLVSSSLVIEAHRQLIELQQKRNKSEYESIETLGLIQIVDNNFSVEGL